MLLDLAVISYYNALRIQKWIGDLATHIEHQWFGMESPQVKFKRQYGPEVAQRLHVEAAATRLAEQLLPLLDRANRLMGRNLRALREGRQPAAPTVNVSNVGQLNVGQWQTKHCAPDRGQRAGAAVLSTK